MTVTTAASRDHARLGGLARGSTANLVGAAVSAMAALALTIVVTRGLPQDSAGVFFAATSLFVLTVAVSQLGTNVGLVYFLSRARSLGQPGTRRRLYRTATRPVVGVAVVMAVGLFVFARQVSDVINADHVEQSVGYLRGAAVLLPVAVLENVTLAGTRGMGTMRANVVTEQLGRPVLQLVLVLTAVTVMDGGLLGLAWAFAYLPAALLAIRYWHRVGARAEQRPQRPHGRPVDGSCTASDLSAREFWRFTAPRAAAGIAQAAMQRLDIVLVAALAGAVPAAIYTASTRFLVLGQMGQRAISLAVQPRLGEALAVADVAQAKQLYRISTSWLMLVTWPMYLLFSFFGGSILTLFGRDYASGRSVLLLLSLAMLLATACGMVDMVLVMAGRSSWSLANLVLSLGVQVGIDVWLIPQYGFFGAAIGWTAGILAANVVPLVQVATVVGLHPFGRSTATTVAVLIGWFVLVPALTRLLLGDRWPALVASLAVGGVGYLASLWRLRNLLGLTALADIRRRSDGAVPAKRDRTVKR